MANKEDEKEKEDEVVAFGKTEKQINEISEALAKKTDRNHPKESDFLNAVNIGHKMLMEHKPYRKKS